MKFLVEIECSDSFDREGIEHFKHNITIKFNAMQYRNGIFTKIIKIEKELEK